MSEHGTGDWAGDMAITGLGLVTPVGLDAPSSIAALRAGVSRLITLPDFEIQVDKGEAGPVIGAEVPKLTEGRAGAARIAKILPRALREAVSDANPAEDTRIGVFLGTSGSRAGGRRLSQTRIIQDVLMNALEPPHSLHLAKLVPAGRAASLRAFRLAAEALEAGRIDLAIFGSADSWVSRRDLLSLRADKKLMEYPRRTGMMPGEAAGFIAVESSASANARGARQYARITAAAGRLEPTPYGEASNALALAQAVRGVWDDVEDLDLLMLTDQNGERYRATEWCLAEFKALNRYDNLQWLTPADCIGDTVAASGAVNVAWAAMALHRNHVGVDRALVWGASDEGAREALRVERTGAA